MRFGSPAPLKRAFCHLLCRSKYVLPNGFLQKYWSCDALANPCLVVENIAKTCVSVPFPRVSVPKRAFRHAHPAEMRVLAPSLPVELCSSAVNPHDCRRKSAALAGRCPADDVDAGVVLLLGALWFVVSVLLVVGSTLN